MIRTALAVLVALSFGAAAQAQDEARPVLKAHATVTGNVVKVGDLVEHAGIVAQVPIFRAPDLGTTGSVPVAAIVAAVARHALIGIDTGGLTDVAVTRPARTIPARDVENAVAEALARQYGLGSPTDVSVTFDGILSAINVEPSALGEPRVASLAYDAGSGRFDASLALPTGAASSGTLHLAGRAVVTAAVVTLAHAVERGAVLKDSDIVVERRPRAEIGRDALQDPDRVRGLAARSNLQTGQIVRSLDLTKPELVSRNQAVTITYAMPGLTLTIRGKALDSGTEGDSIAVLNEQSKRTLQGVIIGPGRVAMGTASPRLAANIATER